MTGTIGVDIIPYRRMKEVHEEIDHLRCNGYAASHAKGQLLLGPPGVGKSVIVQSYAERFPARETDDGWIRPVVLATAGKGQTKPLAESLLTELGDSSPSSGTEHSMLTRAEVHLKEQKTNLIIFDEVQDAMRGDLHDAADFYKRVLNWSICPVLLVGAPRIIELVRANVMLRDRCRRVIRLEGFEWPRDKKTYCQILITMQKQMLPKHIKSVDLHSEPVASKLNYATWGTIRKLTRLIEEALTLAEKSPKKTIDKDILAQAYENFQDQEPPSERRINPFLNDLPKSWKPAQ